MQWAFVQLYVLKKNIKKGTTRTRYPNRLYIISVFNTFNAFGSKWKLINQVYNIIIYYVVDQCTRTSNLLTNNREYLLYTITNIIVPKYNNVILWVRTQDLQRILNSCSRGGLHWNFLLVDAKVYKKHILYDRYLRFHPNRQEGSKTKRCYFYVTFYCLSYCSRYDCFHKA